MTTTESMPVAMQGMHLTWDLIQPDPDNVRADDRTDIESLAQSILINGLVQPIVLTQGNVIIAGHRRYAALGHLIEQAAIPRSYQIPVVYYHGEDLGAGSTQLMLVENLQRVDLNPIEEAQGYVRLVTDYELKHSDVAERVGKSTSLVSSRIRLLKLPEPAQQMLAIGAIGLDVAEALIPLAKYPEVVSECLTLGLSVDQIQSKVNRMKQAERLVSVKEYIDAQGAYAVLDRTELASMDLMIDHGHVPHLFENKAALGSIVKRDEVYYLTVNFKDEVQVYNTLETPKKETPDGEVSPEEQARRDQIKQDNEAKKVRRAKVMEIINVASLPKADIEEHLDVILVQNLTAQFTAFVCTMLGIRKDDVPKHSYSTAEAPAYNYGQALIDILKGGGKKATRVRLAIILCTWEQYALGGISDEYKAVLAQFGYKPNRKGELVPIEVKETEDVG